MKIYKPKFWDTDKSFYSTLLKPLTYVTKLFIFFKKSFIKKSKFNLPIICVGNIYIGGTGKTPTSMLIANELTKKGRKVAIIRKFYQNHSDEHLLIKKHFNNLILRKNRTKAINDALDNRYEFVILDDGFQDYKIIKNLNIVCFNSTQKIGNGLVFPAGPLREDLRALRNAQIVIINGKKDKIFEKKIISANKDIKIFYSRYQPSNLNEFKNQRLFAVAGIGNPENFFNILKENNLNVVEKLIYPDHYKFKKSEILKIIEKSKEKNCQIIMTEKDYYKIIDYNLSNINFLKVNLIIEEKEKLIEKILTLDDKNL